MTCPKCKARIGIFKQELTVDTGPAFGINCFICGYWVHQGVHLNQLPIRPETKPLIPRRAA
ncbi:hypothetical protein [Geobacter argillaceus]|uniref:Uncharacterized protein n=1 Tax=Geobacter argillaceus TaxID=345631 RepID=A0A562VM79_9BACT|nr:hypothetical protein [Geobacter argillaceus]TWJ19073.1 hypothetical protein JN12_02019 [Geobacter argillaceus]